MNRIHKQVVSATLPPAAGFHLIDPLVRAPLAARAVAACVQSWVTAVYRMRFNRSLMAVAVSFDGIKSNARESSDRARSVWPI